MVAVGSTILQEQALASPASAWRRCGDFEVVGVAVPLSMTELITSSATAMMLAARRRTAGTVVVAVSVTVRVVITRVVDVKEVVDAALVVTMLIRLVRKTRA